MDVYGINELKVWVFIHIHANRAWEWKTTGHPQAIVSACACYDSRKDSNRIKSNNKKEAWAKRNKDNK